MFAFVIGFHFPLCEEVFRKIGNYLLQAIEFPIDWGSCAGLNTESLSATQRCSGRSKAAQWNQATRTTKRRKPQREKQSEGLYKRT